MPLFAGSQGFFSQNDTFSGTGNGATIDCSTSPCSNFSLLVNPTGAVTSWTVVLEGSIDGSHFTTILSQTSVIGAGITVFSGSTTSPSFYFRARCSSLILGLGTNIVSTILGTS